MPRLNDSMPSHASNLMPPTKARFAMFSLGLGLTALLADASAQAASWRLLAGEPARFLIPEFPAGARDLSDQRVSDFGGEQFTFRVLMPSAAAGYWVSQFGALTRYTQLSSSGTFGPGRSGAESNHHFLSVRVLDASTSIDGQRSFAARAADPANTGAATSGIWRWNGTQNIEIARAGSEGAFGPGLGAGWSFVNTVSFVEEARMLNAGQVMIHADVAPSAGGTLSRLIARHVPGVGNAPCMRVGANGGGLSPGLEPNDRFQGNSSPTSISVSFDGRVYVRNIAVLSGPRLIEGIWELCNGAPRAIVVKRESGARGPDIGVIGATFEDFANQPPPLPDLRNGLYYFAEYCRTTPCDSPVGVPQVGLFHTTSAGNRGIAYNESSGFFGPNWNNARWKFFNEASLSAAGQTTSFVASVSTADTTDPTGLWRVKSGQRPALVAMIGSTDPAFAPEIGRTWAVFSASAVFSNGDIVLAASTNPGSEEAVWLLPAGQAPRRILSPGQVLALPTVQGISQEIVGSVGIPTHEGDYSSGKDGWVAADGTLVFSVRLVGDLQERVLLSTRLNVPNPFLIFANGFE